MELFEDPKEGDHWTARRYPEWFRARLDALKELGYGTADPDEEKTDNALE